ncbi:MAG: iron-containing alcohol dehydrogenase [Christensenellaceae bacterium]|nr:iron-containing alcohol dehydrogenase [Christensenellaceae bacterium]
MLNYNFYNSTRIIFGKDEEANVGTYAAEYGKKALLHYGGSSAEKSGLLAKVKNSLEASGLEVVMLGGVKPNPRLSMVRKGAEICKKEGIDVIIAVGGGSVIDSAKGIALAAKIDGDIWEYYMDANKQSELKQNIPVGVVLTIPAAGSESSCGSVVTNEEDGMKRFIDAEINIPKFAILDPVLTYTLPAYQTACGAYDMLSHLMERYFTNVENTQLTDELIEGTARTIIENAPKAIETPDDYNARAEMMQAGALAHNGLLNCGRLGDWASHNIGMELSGKYDSAHGETLSIITPAWMKYVFDANPDRFVRFAVKVFDVKENEDKKVVFDGLLNALVGWSKAIGLATTLTEVGITDEHFEEMAHKCIINRGYVGELKQLVESDIVEIFKLAL